MVSDARIASEYAEFALREGSCGNVSAGGADATDAGVGRAAVALHETDAAMDVIVDGMIENAFGTIAIQLGIAAIARGASLLRMLAHKAAPCLARARVFFDAYRFAAADPYRAAIHNKGCINGISANGMSAVVHASGNETRAVVTGAAQRCARLSPVPATLRLARCRSPGRNSDWTDPGYQVPAAASAPVRFHARPGIAGRVTTRRPRRQ